MIKSMFYAIFLFVSSTCANAVIVDGNFSALVYYDGSDEGVWSRDLSGVEVTGKFWYNTALAPLADASYPYSTYYRSETNSWLNLTYFIDGKTIDVSRQAGNNSDFDEAVEVVDINADTNYFRIHDEVLQGDYQGDFVLTSGSLSIRDTADVITHNGLEQNFSWVGDDSYDDRASLIMFGSNKGEFFTSLLEVYLTDLTVATRAVSVPAPSPFPLLLIGLAALIFRRRVDAA
ncbi:MAG: hypothetical protein V4732_04390 [Pseudomonadota bacterium]